VTRPCGCVYSASGVSAGKITKKDKNNYKLTALWHGFLKLTNGFE